MEKTCSADGCSDPIRTKGLCNKHYFRLRRHGSFEVPKTKRERLIAQGMSHCPKCKQIRPLADFNKDSFTAFGVAIYCRFCNKKAGQVRYRSNKEKFRSYGLMKKFGMTDLQYSEMLALQNQSCAICRKPQSHCKKSLGVDHCHKTGKVRGILCDACNHGLGMFKDSEDLMLAAIQYIKKSKIEEK